MANINEVIKIEIIKFVENNNITGATKVIFQTGQVFDAKTNKMWSYDKVHNKEIYNLCSCSLESLKICLNTYLNGDISKYQIKQISENRYFAYVTVIKNKRVKYEKYRASVKKEYISQKQRTTQDKGTGYKILDIYDVAHNTYLTYEQRKAKNLCPEYYYDTLEEVKENLNWFFNGDPDKYKIVKGIAYVYD